ncbi:MAG: DsbA family protein [Pseudomonadota bacterium]|jgi:protein-disulfide isomerase
MRRAIIPLLLAGLLIAPARAAEPAAAPDPALVEAIVNKLERDGTLDRAVERALGRLAQKQQETQRQQQLAAQAKAAERARSARKVVPGRDHIRGNAAADVSLIEYSDFECPFCKRFHPTPGAALQRHAGRVNWVWRHFPLGFHDPAARREAIASECAAKLGGNEVFWKYADAVFAHTRSNGQGLAEGKSEAALAEELGIGRDAFARCFTDPGIARRVDEDIAEGNTVGVSGTPATIVRNNRSGESVWVVGAQPAEALDAAIGQVLGGKGRERRQP